ncbi:MAG: hypothetical protein HYS05_17935 [Acidobacteria bacterium]|nr:hypothetical protein [Acidobacteriota bacterium]
MALLKINRNPSPRELRQFAGIWWPALFGVIAWTIYSRSGSVGAAGAVLGAALIIGAIGFVKPPFMRVIYVGWMTAVFPIGWVVSHAVLGVVFFLVMTPIGLMMRALGRDPMARAFDRTATSYWQPRDTTTDVSRYFRQF